MRNTVTVPYEVADALRTMGSNLRKARLRRNLTIEEVAQRIGVHRETLSMAEKGSPSVSIGTYVTAMWVYGLAKQAKELCSPEQDLEGLALEEADARKRAYPGTGGMSNAF